MDKKLSQGGADRFKLRKAPSIDMDGNPTDIDWMQYPDSASTDPNDANYIAAQGMGWFPGYAIDVESGARLNLCYGEDSYLDDMNGRDMMFNPPQLKKTTVEGYSSQSADPSLFRQVDGDPLLGGKHFVYIWGMDKPTDVSSQLSYNNFNSPAYDGGKYLHDAFAFISTSPQASYFGSLLVASMPVGRYA
jgi:hypothetical protein